MSFYTMLFLIFAIVCIITVIALNPRSKACKLDTDLNANGFKFTFETSEKSTPSNQD